MINRELIRINTIQLVYAYQLNHSKDMTEVVKEMDKSLKEASDLYHHMLCLICDITDYAVQAFEATYANIPEHDKALIQSDKFIKNRFAAQLQDNRALNAFTQSHKELSWTKHEDVVHSIFDNITHSNEYELYLNSQDDNYQADRELWRKLYRKFICDNDLIDEALEECSIYWNCDRAIIDTFVLKTIKRFEQDNGDEQPLLKEYSNADDKTFGRDLLVKTIYGQQEYEALIKQHIRNWDFSRLAKMDVVVMSTALAEIIHFPDISINVTINEYLNIAKMYCDLKNIKFINATLDSIVNDLRKSQRILK